MAGPAIGAPAAFGGPHIPFLVAAAIAGVNALVALRRLPETHPDRTGLPDPGAAERLGASDAPDGPLPSEHPVRTWGHVPATARRLIVVTSVALFAVAGLLYGRVAVPAPYLLGAALALGAVLLVPREPRPLSGTAPT